MKKILILSALILSFPSLSQDWLEDGEVRESVSVIDGKGYGFAQHYVSKKLCNEEIILGLITSIEPELLNINGTNVNVEYVGKSGLGVPFYGAKSSKGRDYLLQQFLKKNEVVVNNLDTNGRSNVFSAVGFSKARSINIKKCKDKNKLKKNAL
ncbi:hypothetical protein [Vibrio aestuarianus]|nr:hypothetical protein [Vibrio aestuarianus]MDE1212357.1 hypothetical protein [Vibrio aestuarianus]MDE1215901.1 hypothetical protein [Vibrio aestuarianus]MDE1255670.1 hypothetical protein [Vibrio aestuarianus]MDE1259483.1 hypothetical protein [Vibrio aestuarianus]MDE1273727.1 hypothetical protein [Vibrio aestuarianus]